MSNHLPNCPCSEFPDGRYCYLINSKSGACIDCECGEHKVPESDEHPDPYVRHYGIKPSLIAAYDDYLAKAISPYLLMAGMYGLEVAIEQIQKDFDKLMEDK